LVALDAAQEMGNKFMTQLQKAIKLLPLDTQKSWQQWTES